ncbi:MAG TPA: helix-turn-helix domain-containing protein [Bryobacteraceae bacterium]|nr:helix-turn-helix domain-containing protein [Bryobacteraceae bacterium]
MMGSAVRKLRKAKGIKQADLATDAGLTVKQLIDIERRDAPVNDDRREKLASLLGVLPQALETPALVGVARQEAEEICTTICNALLNSFRAAREAIARPLSVPAEPTAREKITDRPLADDPTERIDDATSRAIKETILRESEGDGHPFKKGIDYIDEEKGHRRFPAAYAGAGPPQFCVFVDSADDTSQFRRNLGGTSLISVYHHDFGWICAAALDATHARLFSAIRGLLPTALQLPQAFSPDGSNQARALHLGPSGRTTLKGSCANLYLGKPYRVLEAAANCAVLLSEDSGVKEILSFGGSRGGLLCAQGLVDFAVEMRGFRLIDCIAGLLIARDSGCTVVDENGKAFSFGVDRKLEQALATNLSGTIVGYVTQYRRKFICAATETLAQQVQQKIRPSTKPPPVEATGVPHQKGNDTTAGADSVQTYGKKKAEKNHK